MTPQPINLGAFHAWLMSALPADAATIKKDLDIGRRAKLEGYEQFPANAADLDWAMRMLALNGLVEKMGSDWHWLNKPEPVSEQRDLFA